MTTVFRLREVIDHRDPPPSLRQIARDTGLSYTTVHAIYHNATTRVDLATLDALAQALNVDAGELVGEGYVARVAPSRNKGKKRRRE